MWLKKRIIFIFIIFFCFNVYSEVKVLTIENKTYKGDIIGFLAPELVIRNRNGINKIDLRNIIEIVCCDSKQMETLTDCNLILGDNSVVFGSIRDGDAQFISFLSNSFGTLAVELTQIKEVLFSKKNLKKLAFNNTENDILYFKSSDKMSCIIEKFGRKYVSVQSDILGERRVYFDKLDRISFTQIMQMKKKENKLSTSVVGIDNSIISGDIVNMGKDNILFKWTLTNSEIQIPLRNIKRILFQNGNFEYLSDMNVKEWEIKYTPYLPGPSSSLELKFDSNQRGVPIKLGDEIYYKGIGTISKTEITIPIRGMYKRFQSIIGIDDEIKKNFEKAPYLIGGSVLFRILLDNREVFNSGTMKWIDKPKSVDIDIQGKNTIKLITDFSDNANVNDLANWAAARFIK